jgi:hypothetical protein
MLELLTQAKCPVLKFIPKGARRAFSRSLKELLLHVAANPDDTQRWLRLLLFPFLCLKQPERGGKRKRKSLASLVIANIGSFNTSASAAALIAPPKKTQRHTKKPAGIEQLARLVADKIDEGDVKGAVRLTCSDATVAPFDQATYEKLLT